MAASTTVTVQALSTTAAAIAAATAGAGARDIYLQNLDASIVIYIGDANDVGVANGLHLAAGAILKIEVDDWDEPALWAESASGTPNLGVMVVPRRR